MTAQDDDIFSEGAKRLRKLIKEKNIKPTDIVNALGVSKETVSKWMQDSATPNAQNLLELAKLLGVTERWVSEFKENKDVAKSNIQKNHHQVKADQEGVALKDASPDQLIAELKYRYAALNLKAEIKITVEPIDGGFVVKDH